MIFKDTGPVQKLTKRETDYEDIEEVPKIKISKIAKQQKYVKQCSTKCKEISMKPNIFDNPPVYLTRLFDNKEICVINGNDELSKEQIEKILLQHKAKVVQNPLKENYCIIVGNAKTVNILLIINFVSSFYNSIY